MFLEFALGFFHLSGAGGARSLADELAAGGDTMIKLLIFLHMHTQTNENGIRTFHRHYPSFLTVHYRRNPDVEMLS